MISMSNTALNTTVLTSDSPTSAKSIVKSFASQHGYAKLAAMPHTAPETVEEYPWMLGIARGDQECLKLLIKKWQKPVYHFFYRFLQQRETAEDLTQNVFIRIYRAAPQYQPSARFSTYLFHIARKVLYNEYRRQQRKPSTGLLDLSPQDQEQAMRGTSNSKREEWEEWMASALQQLPDRQKEVMLLHVQQGMGYEEIAEIQQASVSTVKSLLFRARQTLKSLLNDNF